MIDNEYGKYVLVCDVCGEEVNGFESFDDALDYVQEEGWGSEKGLQLNLEYGYIDICPDCQK